MLKNIIYSEKEDYTLSLDLVLPEFSINRYYALAKAKTTTLNFPTQIILTDGEEYITITITILGFGLSFYLRSKSNES